MELTKALSLFKTIKNAVHLMLFHEFLTNIGQYSSENPYYDLYLFIKDIFNRDYRLHKEAKKVLSEALKLLVDEEVSNYVIEQLCRTKISDAHKSAHYKAHPMGRMNFFIKEFVFEINLQGKQTILNHFEGAFKQQYYVFF